MACDVVTTTAPLNLNVIGPRSVIVPADPIEWSAETSYEYLTLVSSADFGQGYISKKDVPSGTPLTNTDYWIPVASFNAQLAAIQQSVTSNEQAIAAETTRATEAEGNITVAYQEYVKNNNVVKTALVIGDSWCEYSGTAVDDSFGIYYTTIYKSVKGGAGFVGNSEGKTFNDLLDDILPSVTVPISDIIVVGGINDMAYVNSVGSPMDSFINTVKGNALTKNARKVFVFNCGNDSIRAGNLDKFMTYASALNDHGFAFIDEAVYSIIGTDLWDADGYHLISATAYKRFFNIALSYANGGNGTFRYYSNQITPTNPSENITLGSNKAVTIVNGTIAFYQAITVNSEISKGGSTLFSVPQRYAPICFESPFGVNIPIVNSSNGSVHFVKLVSATSGSENVVNVNNITTIPTGSYDVFWTFKVGTVSTAYGNYFGLFS